MLIKKNGFTLVELLVVVAIIGILSAVGVIAYGKYTDSAKNIIIKSYNIRISKTNIDKLIKNFDIVCDGTDNFKTRLLVNDHALKQKKILISAAVSGFDGHIFKFNFKKKTPCYRCFLPEIPEQNNNCETEGVIPTITGVMGNLQANEVVNSILNFNSNMEKKI